MLRGLLLSSAVLLTSCAQQATGTVVTSVNANRPLPPPAVVTPPTPSQPPIPQFGVSQRDDVAVSRFREAMAELEHARREHPERHEAIYNEAILLDEYAMLLGNEEYYRALDYAAELYRLYLSKAANDPDARDTLRNARVRLERITEVTHCDFSTTELQRKNRAIEEKQRAAEEEVRRMEEEDARNGKK